MPEIHIVDVYPSAASFAAIELTSLDNSEFFDKAKSMLGESYHDDCDSEDFDRLADAIIVNWDDRTKAVKQAAVKLSCEMRRDGLGDALSRQVSMHIGSMRANQLYADDQANRWQLEALIFEHPSSIELSEMYPYSGIRHFDWIIDFQMYEWVRAHLEVASYELKEELTPILAKRFFEMYLDNDIESTDPGERYCNEHYRPFLGLDTDLVEKGLEEFEAISAHGGYVSAADYVTKPVADALSNLIATEDTDEAVGVDYINGLRVDSFGGSYRVEACIPCGPEAEIGEWPDAQLLADITSDDSAVEQTVQDEFGSELSAAHQAEFEAQVEANGLNVFIGLPEEFEIFSAEEILTAIEDQNVDHDYSDATWTVGVFDESRAAANLRQNVTDEVIEERCRIRYVSDEVFAFWGIEH